MLISLLLSIFTFILLFLFEKHVFNALNAQSSFQGLFYSKKTIEISFLKTLEHFYVRLGLMLLYSGLLANISGNAAHKIVFAGVGTPIKDSLWRVSILNFAKRITENIAIKNAK